MHGYNDDPEIANFVADSYQENPDVPVLRWNDLMFRVAFGLQNWLCDGHIDCPAGSAESS